MSRRTVAIVGSTGSIGTQTLDVISHHPDRFEVVALACGRRDDIIQQAKNTGARLIGVADDDLAGRVREALPDVEVCVGAGAAADIAGSGADVVINGIDGGRGLEPTLAALHAGSQLALANKESLIVGGDLVREARQRADQIVPVDSEHSAIAQCMRGEQARDVGRLVLTASGGPFRGRDRADLATVTVADALNHPTWDMGPAITINSATLANKGLEVIEAHLLFDIDFDDIDVVVHPQSIVHSMVEFTDGATIAKLSPPDMRLPIQLALTWPERLDFAPTRMDWGSAVQMTFEPLDHDTFPMVQLARQAGRAGGTAPAVFNAANEAAVAAFLDGRLSFLGIADVVGDTLEVHQAEPIESLEHVRQVIDEARTTARAHITRRA